MDAILSFPADGLYVSAETLDLHPQRLQAFHVVVQIDHCHLGAWMDLAEEHRGGGQN